MLGLALMWLIELDKRTAYLDCFTHATDKQARSSRHTVLISDVTGPA